MISVFKRTRLKIMAKKKKGGYLFYAFGEIFLVVIGILIALGLNNWNERKAEKNDEAFFLKSIMENIIEDENELEKIISFQTERRAIRIELYNELDRKQKNRAKIEALFTQISDMNLTFFPNNSAFNSIKSSGDLNLIQNKSLQIQLSSLYDKTYYRIDYNGVVYDQRVEKNSTDLKNDYSLELNAFTNWDVVENGTIRNIVSFEQDYNDYYVSLLEAALVRVKDIKTMLNKELSRFD